MNTPTTAPSRTRAPRPNPAPIRRRCRLIEVTGGIAHFACYSMTREGREICHQPAIDLSSGACTCSCEHFEYKLARLNPTVFSPDEALCKHLHRSIEVARRHDMLPQQRGQFAPACLHCGGDAEFEVCDERGRAIAGQFQCLDCITARVDDLSDAAPEGFTPPPADDDDISGIFDGDFAPIAPAPVAPCEGAAKSFIERIGAQRIVGRADFDAARSYGRAMAGGVR